MERRTAHRERRLKGARVIFNARQSVLNCQVRDVSETGFRLAMNDAYRVPDIFFLSIGGAPERPARKVWIGKNEIGAAFT